MLKFDILHLSFMETCFPRTITVRSDGEELSRLARIFGALSEPVRLRIIGLMTTYGEICTCEIASALHLKQPTITHHLKLLEGAGVIYRRPKGKWTFFGVTGERVNDVLLLASSIGGETKPSGPVESGRSHERTNVRSKTISVRSG